MSADFISGLLLFSVLLFGAAYVIKEFFWESLSGLMTRQRTAAPARQPNDHLVGAIGRVVDDGTGSGVMRVRVGMEIWRARAVDAVEAAAALPVGTQVEIKAVDGLVLDVAGHTPAAEPPEAPQPEPTEAQHPEPTEAQHPEAPGAQQTEPLGAQQPEALDAPPTGRSGT